MGAISGISMNSMMSSAGVSAGAMGNLNAGQDISSTSSIHSTGMSSISSSSHMESMISTSVGSAANNDLMGAMLLMLTLEYMKNDTSDSKKKDILGMMGALLQQGAGSGSGSNTMMYSSMTIESSTTQVVSSGAGLAAYNAAASTTSQVPGADAASAGLDVVA